MSDSNNTYCSWNFCRQGHCEGCRDGNVWCSDPRCFPFCPGESCFPPEGHTYETNVVFFILIFVLLFLMTATLLLYGPRYVYIYNDYESYNLRGIDYYLD